MPYRLCSDNTTLIIKLALRIEKLTELATTKERHKIRKNGGV